jgi:hypothetical protein
VTSPNQPPVASFTFSPANPNPGDTVTFRCLRFLGSRRLHRSPTPGISGTETQEAGSRPHTFTPRREPTQ